MNDHQPPNLPLIAARVIGTVLWIPTIFIYVASPLVAPVWGTFLLWLIAIGWLAVSASWWKRRLVRYGAAPLGALVTWQLVVLAGDVFAGWTA